MTRKEAADELTDMLKDVRRIEAGLPTEQEKRAANLAHTYLHNLRLEIEIQRQNEVPS